MSKADDMTSLLGINNGVGGWYDVGCLRYGFWPFTFNIGANPANYTLFWPKMSYCGN